MSPLWLRLFEGWLTARLLSSPTFHRGVERVYKAVRKLKHGPDIEDMGGTDIEKSNSGKKFLDHYMEELKDQFRGRQGPKR